MPVTTRSQARAQAKSVFTKVQDKQTVLPTADKPVVVTTAATNVSATQSASGYDQVMSVYIFNATGGKCNNTTRAPVNPPKSRFSCFAKFMSYFTPSRSLTNIAAASSNSCYGGYSI